MPREFLSPVGRLVQGSCWELQTTDSQGKPLTVKTGKNAGQPATRSFIAIAIDKQNPEFLPFWQLMEAEAKEQFAELFNQQGQMTHPRFSWKYMDGDGTDQNGKSNADKEGFAGHHIIKFSGSFLPRCYEAGKYDNSQVLTDPNRIKRGYFVRVGGIMKGNKPSDVPGLYLNHGLVELMFHGPEIVGGPDAAAIFGGRAAGGFVPQGAIALGQSVGAPMGGLPGAQVVAPMGNGPMGQQGMGGTPQGGPMGGAPMGGSVGPGGPAMGGPAGMPGAQVTPNAGFVAGAMGTPQGPGGPVAGIPNMNQQRQPVLVPTAKATGYTIQQFYQNGFTDANLVEQGYFVWN